MHFRMKTNTIAARNPRRDKPKPQRNPYPQAYESVSKFWAVAVEVRVSNTMIEYSEVLVVMSLNIIVEMKADNHAYIY